MGIRINTNVASLNTQRHLYNSTIKFNKSMEKLSSGLRINRAGDDAAGLAISEGLKSDIRALHQASRNASDGISLVQTAEGALDEVSNILLRMKELTEQSLTGTLSDTERGYLNAEYQALQRRDRPDRRRHRVQRHQAARRHRRQRWHPGRHRHRRDLRQHRTWTSAPIATRPAGPATAGIDTAQRDGGHGRDRRRHRDGEPGPRRLRCRPEPSGKLDPQHQHHQAENLSAANSRIRDVDVASETSRMTSYQILQQAGVSMLAQANMSTGLAMSLLQ